MVQYVSTTAEITITVRPVYLDRESNVFDRRFVFGYFVRIENQGTSDVQLLRRRWLIQETTGRVQEVEGDGVIGKQPVITPGGAHQYNSFVVLASTEGIMEGDYLMERADGERFRAVIPRFDLRAMAN